VADVTGVNDELKVVSESWLGVQLDMSCNEYTWRVNVRYRLLELMSTICRN
jgi:hypothetical protein